MIFDERLKFDTGLPTMIDRIKTPDQDLAQTARKTIRAEIARRNESGSEFDGGFACGLSFALGAFSGVCEDNEPTKKGADHE